MLLIVAPMVTGRAGVSVRSAHLIIIWIFLAQAPYLPLHSEQKVLAQYGKESGRLSFVVPPWQTCPFCPAHRAAPGQQPTCACPGRATAAAPLPPHIAPCGHSCPVLPMPGTTHGSGQSMCSDPSRAASPAVILAQLEVTRQVQVCPLQGKLHQHIKYG